MCSTLRNVVLNALHFFRLFNLIQFFVVVMFFEFTLLYYTCTHITGVNESNLHLSTAIASHSQPNNKPNRTKCVSIVVFTVALFTPRLFNYVRIFFSPFILFFFSFFTCIFHICCCCCYDVCVRTCFFLLHQIITRTINLIYTDFLPSQ